MPPQVHQPTCTIRLFYVLGEFMKRACFCLSPFTASLLLQLQVLQMEIWWNVGKRENSLLFDITIVDLRAQEKTSSMETPNCRVSTDTFEEKEKKHNIVLVQYVVWANLRMSFPTIINYLTADQAFIKPLCLLWSKISFLIRIFELL